MTVARTGSILVATLILAAVGRAAHAAEPGGGTERHTRVLEGAPPQASMDDVDWLIGHWRGSGLGGSVEEIWSRPSEDVVCGMFTMWKDSGASFHEIFTLREEEGTLVLVLKHFGADLKGWEEKDERVRFPLVEATDDAVYFHGLTYAKDGDDAMRVWVSIRGSDGASREAELRFQRVRDAG